MWIHVSTYLSICVGACDTMLGEKVRGCKKGEANATATNSTEL